MAYTAAALKMDYGNRRSAFRRNRLKSITGFATFGTEIISNMVDILGKPGIFELLGQMSTP